MQILADSNMTSLDETFGRCGNLAYFDGRTLTRDHLGDAEVLLVRSVTSVDAALLEGSSVRFVGTATIGTDHIDTLWLDQQEIAWASAPGCNADAAAQYTLGMLLLSMQRLGRNVADQQVAIIGHGNVGSRLHMLLDALGVAVVICDPPLGEAGLLRSATLAEALRADIISLHVPLQQCGPYPTHHMINSATLAQTQSGALLLNASRGDVIEGEALLDALRDRHLHAALDVWPSEPCINPLLLSSTTVATPHVAGYSVEGKRRGTRLIFEAFKDWCDQAGSPQLADVADTRSAVTASPVAGSARPVSGADEAVIHATHVAQDDARMRAALPENAASFDALRRAHAPRHEFKQHLVSAPDDQARVILRSLGFRTSP